MEKSKPKISSLIEVAEQLASSQRELEAQKRALDEAAIVAITDQRGTITYVNDKFCEISKYSREELIGQNHRIVKSEAHGPEFFRDLWRTIGRGKVWRGTIKNRAKDNTPYWVSTTIVPFLDAEGKPYQHVAIRHDVTDKVLSEMQLATQRQQLIESEKMASLGILAAGIAHEIGNPLGALRGRLEMLQMKAEKGQTITPDEIIKTSARSLALIDNINKIVKGLRAYSREGSSEEFIQIDLCSLIVNLLELSKEKFRREGISVKTKGLSQACKIRARETEIGQVIVNLLNNSVHAIEKEANKWISVELVTEEKDVVLKIFDSGPGVPESLKDRIMDPFFTTKPVGQGTGLGLSISKRIMESHGGSLTYDDSSKSTCFIITIPKP